MLRVLCGRSGDGRTEAAFDAAEPGRALFVVRNRPRRDALRDRAAARRGVSFDDGAVVFDELVARLSARRARARKRLDPAARDLLLDDLAEAARPPLRGAPGLAGWLGRLFSTLKQADVFTAARALTTFPSLSDGGAGADEALRLFDLYGARLVADELYDEDGLAFELARDLGTPELPFDVAVPGRGRLTVEGFYRTTPVERAVFAALFGAFDATTWLLDAPSPDALEDPSVAVYADYVVGGARFSGDVAWLRACGARFETGPAAPPPRPAPEAYVHVDARAEARWVAAQVAAALAEDPSADPVVAAPSDRDAAPLYREAFDEAGTPLDVRATDGPAAAPRARAAAELLSLSDRGFPRDATVAALRNAFRYEGPDGPKKLRAAQVERVARAAGVVGGRAEWLSALAAETARRRDAAARVAEADRETAARRLADAEEVERGMRAFLAANPDPADELSGEAFVATATRLLETVGAFSAGRTLPPRFDVLEARAAAADAAAATGLIRALETYRRADGLLRRPPRSWRAHRLALLRTLERAPIVARPSTVRGARLLGLRDFRGSTASHVFVVGLDERALPESGEAPPLLSEADAARAGARTAEARRREAAHALAHAACAGTRRIVFSRSERRDDATVHPSPTWAEVAPHLVPSPAPPAPPVGRRRLGEALGAASRAGDAASAVALAPAAAAAGCDLALASARAASETARRDPRSASRYEGLLEAAALPLLAATYDARSATWSASRFDEYAACPLRFFFERVLGVDAPEEPERDVGPLESGTFLHRVLYRYYADGAAEEAAAEARERALARIAREESARSGRADVYATSHLERQVAGLAGEAPGAGPLKRFVDFEAGRPGAYRVRFVEATFGPQRGDEGGRTAWSEAPARLVARDAEGRERAFLLVGAADRVEVRADAGGERLVVVDYKSGSADRLVKGAGRGRGFQLALYGRVFADAAAQAGTPTRVAGGAYYVLSPKKFDLTSQLVDADEVPHLVGRKPSRSAKLGAGGFEAFVDKVTARAADVVDAVAEGRFHPHRLAGEPFEGGCAWCDFATACRGRGEAERLSAASDPRLFPQDVDLLGGPEDAP
ncbi:MAG TPA: PD-(D/E)XK nuclease family protein [Planctomycetota bacterium]|nr:PD-(D/E)XK nuclease family protein [Planctomycetota bacterium]